MNLKIINNYIAQYKNIASAPDYDGWRLWELAHQFQTNWDMDAADFRQMFQNSFKINSPLWYRDGYEPVKAMLRYIDLNEDFVRVMFLDLFNDDKDIAGRISRFQYQMDLLYKEERRKTQKIMPHYHDDRKMIHTYLAFRYPDKYSLFDFPSFKLFMDKVGSKSAPQREDIERFVKVCKTLKTLILKDEELVELVKNKVSNITGGNNFSMLMIFELYNLVKEYK